jgi:D-alanyl-D-alanine carboxypeptidase
MDNPTIITIDEEKWYMTLVNSSYRIPDDYEPDLVYVCGSGERLDRKVAEHYEEMYNAAQKEGINLAPCSGYRSYELQERNYNNKVSFYESQGYSNKDAKVKAATIIMPPGSSEHNLGYAMDIVCVEEWFEDTAEFKWLTEHAADYGFIMRYPKDKQDITKVIYEPWHWRYVGVELAKELKDSGLVLEEYMGVA